MPQVIIAALIYAFFFLKPIEPGVYFLGASAIGWTVLALASFSRERNVSSTLLHCLIYSVPVSYEAVNGQPFGELPITWFHVFLVMLSARVGLYVVLNHSLKVGRISLAAILFAAFCVPAVLISNDPVAAIKQFIHIIGLALSIVSGENIWPTLSDRPVSDYLEHYLFACALAGTGLLSQIALATYAGIVMGTTITVGGGRTAWCFVFNDYSFLSIYIASGAAIAFAKLVGGHSRVKYGFFFSLLLVASIQTSARAGLAGLLMGLLAGLVFRSEMGAMGRRRVASILVMGIVAVIGYYGFQYVRPQDAFEDSGRLENYLFALSLFLENPLYGVGLGVGSFKEMFFMTIPHNLIIQYLLQAGLIATLLLVVILVATLRRANAISPLLFLPLATCVAGGMLIPDLINSRFYLVLILFSMLAIPQAANEVEVDQSTQLQQAPN